MVPLSRRHSKYVTLPLLFLAFGCAVAGCAVDQHFFARKRTADMTGLMKLYPQLLGIGIDEATAIVVTGHVAEVLGKSKVAFYDYRDGPPAGETDYIEVKAGEKYDLKERKKQ